MRKILSLFSLLLLCIGGAWAQTYHFATAPTQVNSITSGKYYAIDGLNQVNTTSHFLFDNGTKITSNNPQSLPTDYTAEKYIWKIEGNDTDGYTLQNLATGNYMYLGSYNGSTISSSNSPQTNGIFFSGDYATIRNSNGQAIDIGAYGSNPTTWPGSQTPEGSRRLKIYEVTVLDIIDDACYTIDFNSLNGTKTWGLKAGISQQSAVANGTGDVFVAHSYTNDSGDKRWIFVNNLTGEYLAYHGDATSAFDLSNAINEWNINSIVAGSDHVSATAEDCSNKLCITNDKRYTGNNYKGCYILKEASGAYDNSSAPYYDGSFTSALTFTATGDAVSDAAKVAIAKFEALIEVRAYLPYAANISALFANPSNVVSEINAATDATTATSIATAFMKSPEGKKFHAVNSTATDKYLNIGTSQITATATKLYADAIMELEYAGSGKYYLKGTKSGYYVGNPVSGGANPGTHASKANATPLFVGNYANTTDNVVYFARTKIGNNNPEAIHYNSGYTAQGSVVAWAYTAGASQWNITAVSDEEYEALCNVCDVTYNVILAESGEVKASSTQAEVIGATFYNPGDATRDFCTYTYFSDNACTVPITTIPNATSATVYALASIDAPFTVSTDYSNAIWHNLSLKDSTYPSFSTESTPNVTLPTAPSENEDNVEWAFIGNPYDGYQIINKAAGEGYVLGSESAAGDGDDGGKTYATLATEGTQTYELWFPKSSTFITNGFYLFNGAGHALNQRSNNNLAYWTGGYDKGSTFMVSGIAENTTELTTIINALDLYPYGSAFGEYSLSGSYAGYTSIMPTSIIPWLKTDYSYYRLMMARTLLNATSINLPSAGQFLFVKGGNSGKYVKYGDKVNSRYPMGNADDTAIFYFDGTHMLSYSSGIYWGVTGGNWNWAAIGGSGSEIKFAESNSMGKYFVKLTSVETTKPDVLLYDNSTNCDRGGFNGTNGVTDARYTWNLEAVTELPIALANCKEYLNASEDVFYTTLYMPVKVKVTGAEVYKVVEGAEANTLDMELIADGVVPANTGVILKNDTGAATATICTDESTETSVLTGTAPAIVKPESDVYVLSVANEKLGFYKFAGETMKGFRAYYAPETSSDARGFVLNLGETTSIGSSLVTGNSSQVYDLQGRRVIAPAKGLYIINGKKVVK